MTYKLTKYEKETSVLYNQSNEPMLISAYDPNLKKRLADFAEKYPDLCKRVDKKKDPDFVEYEVEKSRVSIRLVPPYSEERKQAAAEKVRLMFHNSDPEQKQNN